ncbi:hypothetical protein F4604DRAFT_1998347 [Suillus subluteus]|nr:hypothetical protein F4604DRAFT_1998347 [Suillus subluteus]
MGNGLQRYTPFQKDVVSVEHRDETHKFEMHYRPLWDWALDLLQDCRLAYHFVFDAQRLSKFNGEQFVRFIDEPWTADAFWNAQGYPIIARIANLPVHIRNGNTALGGGRVVGWLPIVAEDQQHTRKKSFVDFKNAVWHKSFYQLLHSIELHSKTGYWFECGDQIQCRLWPLILILSRDYEEQCVMALIRGLKGKLPCPICLVPRDEQSANRVFALHECNSQHVLRTARAKRTEKEREEDLKAHSLRNVENVFWKIFLADVHRALSVDRLHMNHEGLWEDHLWKDFLFWISNLGREAAVKLDANFDALPRWPNLTHFKAVVSVDFNDGSFHEDISKSKLGYLLLRCIRYYIELDIYACWKFTPRRRLRWKGNPGYVLRIDGLGTETNKNWNFPKKHMITRTYSMIFWLKDVAPQNGIPLPDGPGRVLRLQAEDQITEFRFLCSIGDADLHLAIIHPYDVGIGVRRRSPRIQPSSAAISKPILRQASKWALVLTAINVLQLTCLLGIKPRTRLQTSLQTWHDTASMVHSPIERLDLTSRLIFRLADEDDRDQHVAPPGEGASVEHFQEYIKYLQLQHGKLEQRNVTLNESNNVLNAQQLKRSHKRPLKVPSSNTISSASQPSSGLSAASPPALSATSASSKASDTDKLILGLAKKYAITTEMFLPDKVNFQTDCPDPPADISSPNRYARKSTEKDALVTDLIGWEAGKGKVFDVFKAPILYPDNVVNEKRAFKNWLVLAKVLKVAVCGKMSLFPKARGGPPPYAKIWQLTSCTPGLIAFGVTSKFFVVKWGHERIKNIVQQINNYIFDGATKTQPDCTLDTAVEDVTDSLDRVMAALDAESDSDGASLYDPEPSTETKTRHKSPPISLPPTPAVSQTVHSTPAPIVHNDLAISGPSVSESTSSSTQSLPVAAVPHAAAASVNIQTVEATPEGVLAAADTGTSAKTQRKAVRNKKIKASVNEAEVRRSSRNTGTIAK